MNSFHACACAIRRACVFGVCLCVCDCMCVCVCARARVYWFVEKIREQPSGRDGYLQ